MTFLFCFEARPASTGSGGRGVGGQRTEVAPGHASPGVASNDIKRPKRLRGAAQSSLAALGTSDLTLYAMRPSPHGEAVAERPSWARLGHVFPEPERRQHVGLGPCQETGGDSDGVGGAQDAGPRRSLAPGSSELGGQRRSRRATVTVLRESPAARPGPASGAPSTGGSMERGDLSSPAERRLLTKGTFQMERVWLNILRGGHRKARRPQYPVG